MSYIPNNITNQNEKKSININDILNEENNTISQSNNQINNNFINNNSINNNQINNNQVNNNQINNTVNNIDPIQEQFKRMSERHKQKKLQEEQRKKEEELKKINNKVEENNKKNNDNNENDNNKNNDNNDNNDNNENEENNNTENNENSNNINYIKIIESDLDIPTQHKNHLLNLIFNDYTIIYIQYYKHKLKLRSLISIDSEQAYKSASNYPENQFYSRYQLFILSYAILEIDDYIFSNYDECLEFLYKLPHKDIDKLYTVFYDNIKKQNEIINNISYFYDLVNEPFFRMKYKVMKAFNCLPTEQRCKQLNDAQWLWLYYNLEEDMFEKMDETQDNLDYIGFYLNSDAAKKIMKHNQDYRKKRDQKRKARFANSNVSTSTKDTNNKDVNNKKAKDANANQVLDNFFTSTPVTNDNTVYNTAFEQELAQALGTTDISKFTEISDDNEAGNPFESEEEFLERLKTFAPVAGTNYGYIKPEKPPKIRVARRDNYSPNANLENGGESRIQHYLRNTVKQHQLKNADINPLPIQNDLKSLNNQNNNKPNLNNNLIQINPLQQTNNQFNNNKINNNRINNNKTNNNRVNNNQFNNNQINTNVNNNQFNSNQINNNVNSNNNINNDVPIQNKKMNKQQILDARKQQADLEFMHKMNITNLQEMENFKNMRDDKNLDFIEFDDE